jgi:hypothetical protein
VFKRNVIGINKMVKNIRIIKVVSRNFIMDFFSKIQNMFGVNLTLYEKMVEQAMTQIDDELKETGMVFKWYRYEITQLTNGAVAVLMYGDTK